MSDLSHVIIGGAPEGFDAELILNEVERCDGPVVHIARDDKRLAALQEAIRFYAPDTPLLIFPSWDCLPYDRVSPNKEISCLRVAALTSLLRDPNKTRLVITTTNAISQRVPPKDYIQESSLFLQTEKSFQRDDLISKLVEIGYVNSSAVTEKGEFAIRGSILDIFASTNFSSSLI